MSNRYIQRKKWFLKATAISGFVQQAIPARVLCGHVFRERSEHHTFSLGASTAKGYSFLVEFEGVGNGRNVDTTMPNRTLESIDLSDTIKYRCNKVNYRRDRFENVKSGLF
ncbi:hypothetical protein HZR23_10790 [Serpentinicella alkaliphila]|uniref:hypothetical protein n=1 Tax=Serpentinicella alkaliphila TaxID=1734049 RepID=UPI001BC83EB3|nr:hypothetical protein [Serpentinicella alkaliphila]QUH26168.1 hypothetical protein HZR23_10790 [Serpentinicella alkaliphila]